MESIVEQITYGQSNSYLGLVTPHRKLELKFTIEAAQLNGIDIYKATIMSDVSINQKVDFDEVTPAFSINKSQKINTDEQTITYSIIITEINDHMENFSFKEKGDVGSTIVTDRAILGRNLRKKSGRQAVAFSRQNVQQWLGEEVVITLGVLASNQ